jgi:hypothetical protein
MSGNLQEAIASANQKAGRERQKVFAKKSYLKTTEATRAENICCRGEELIAEVFRMVEHGHTDSVAKAIDALKLAIRIDRREREAGR